MDLLAALNGLITPDNRLLREAGRFSNYLRSTESVGGLMSNLEYIAQPNPAIRQVSGVLLRKVINKHWGRLNMTTRRSIQDRLLQVVTQEPDSQVRRAVASVISRLAKHLLPQWVDLLSLIQQCAAQENSAYRQLSMLLLYQMVESISRTLTDMFDGLANLLAALLQDPEYGVRRMASKKQALL